ncbi:MAG: response regulator, partial [Deltaproteobacteria bacterium]
MRILIVEDSVTMRRVMEMTFAGEDADLLSVESGELALAQGRDFGPDVAFIDASLPGIDGYEVTRAMKSDPQLAGTAVVLMASQHRPLDEARASESAPTTTSSNRSTRRKRSTRRPPLRARPRPFTKRLRFRLHVRRLPRRGPSPSLPIDRRLRRCPSEAHPRGRWRQLLCTAGPRSVVRRFRSHRRPRLPCSRPRRLRRSRRLRPHLCRMQEQPKRCLIPSSNGSRPWVSRPTKSKA